MGVKRDLKYSFLTQSNMGDGMIEAELHIVSTWSNTGKRYD